MYRCLAIADVYSMVGDRGAKNMLAYGSFPDDEGLCYTTSTHIDARRFDPDLITEEVKYSCIG